MEQFHSKIDASVSDFEVFVSKLDPPSRFLWRLCAGVSLFSQVDTVIH